jgi:DNA-binding IclR family transcriptional regulator
MNKTSARTVDILEFISQSSDAVTIAQISKELGIPKSSVFDIVHTLVRKRFLDTNEITKTFQLGFKCFAVGNAFTNKSDLQSLSRPALQRISNETHETVFLAVENNGMIVYLDKVEGQSPIRTSCVIGERNYLHLTGLGKAILATYSDIRVKEITGGGDLITRTRTTHRHYDDLLEDLSNIRERGYSIDNGEGIDNLYCIAAPIVDKDNKTVAAISIATLYSKMSDEKIKYFSSLIMNEAMNVSRSLGFTSNDLYSGYYNGSNG